jgi:hypothetical protein
MVRFNEIVGGALTQVLKQIPRSNSKGMSCYLKSSSRDYVPTVPNVSGVPFTAAVRINIQFAFTPAMLLHTALCAGKTFFLL